LSVGFVYRVVLIKLFSMYTVAYKKLTLSLEKVNSKFMVG